MKSPKQKSLGRIAIEADEKWHAKGYLFPNRIFAEKHREQSLTKALSTAVRARQKRKGMEDYPRNRRMGDDGKRWCCKHKTWHHKGDICQKRKK